jgi:hypothetical protein
MFLLFLLQLVDKNMLQQKHVALAKRASSGSFFRRGSCKRLPLELL